MLEAGITLERIPTP